MTDSASQLKSKLRGKKILITSGPTCVSVDKMRVISNRATGELGQKIATALDKAGAEVTLLEGPVLNPFRHRSIRIEKFYFYDELASLIAGELKQKYDVVIHNAAVSDYRLAEPFDGKIDSGRKSLTLKLVPTAKLINSIKKMAPKVFLVGFKLEDFHNTKEIFNESRKLFNAADCDLVVANKLNGGYQGYIVSSDSEIVGKGSSRAELTANLVKALQKRLTR